MIIFIFWHPEEYFVASGFIRELSYHYTLSTSRVTLVRLPLTIERYKITFTANGKRQKWVRLWFVFKIVTSLSWNGKCRLWKSTTFVYYGIPVCMILPFFKFSLKRNKDVPVARISSEPLVQFCWNFMSPSSIVYVVHCSRTYLLPINRWTTSISVEKASYMI